jgi:CRISPR-associated protein Cmr2
MPIDWEDVLLAYLHDPPDKALDIPAHVRRACRYAATVLGREVVPQDFGKHADQLASAVERLPMPTAGKDGERAIGPRDGCLHVVHPLAGDGHDLRVGGVDEDAVLASLDGVARLPGLQARYLALWRLWPERLAQRHPWLGRLPADTRTPDHTIWNHLDITAGLQAALSGPKGAAFLSFALGPVQSFIAAARTVRDLWSGSMILSYLAFQGMLPVVEELGPTALVYPSPRGLPLLDLWLRNRPGLADLVVTPAAALRKAPCLPNRFVAVVPWGVDGDEAAALADRCRGRTLEAWQRLAQAVRAELQRRWDTECPGWDCRWDSQIDNFLDVRTAVLPWWEADDAALARLLAGRQNFAEAFPDAQRVRELVKAIPEADRPRYGQESAGQWQHRLELSARLMEAQRSVRHVPAPTPDETVPPKCSLLGSYEQMGPDGLDDSRQFWEDVCRGLRRRSLGGVRLGPRERLCAVALVKRFSGPAFFRDELQLADPRELRFPDTATVAAGCWLARARRLGFTLLDPDAVRQRGGVWSGQWLHWTSTSQDGDEDPCPEDVFAQIRGARARQDLSKPPAYYAVLMMDGDEMGAWLSGAKTPAVRKIMHPALRDGYFGTLPDRAAVTAALDAPRPVGPALHAAISEALANFSLHVVPPVVKKHDGTLIYAGGDDVLALLPTSTALACAAELRQAFSGERAVNGGADRGYYRADGRDLLVPGPKASLSAGLAVVHSKEDLRFALEQARRAERQAKDAGRDALQITVCRRSGEHSTALCPWDYVGRVAGWVDNFHKGASDRWAYHLKGSLDTLAGLEPAAVRAEIRRQVGRAEERTRELLSESAPRKAGDILAADFADYHARVAGEQARKFSDGQALTHFLTLCQTASFLARGRDA